MPLVASDDDEAKGGAEESDPAATIAVAAREGALDVALPPLRPIIMPLATAAFKDSMLFAMTPREVEGRGRGPPPFAGCEA